MIRWGAFLLVAATAAGFAYWVYTRVELPVRSSRRLAAVRIVVLVTIILLLFDPRLPLRGAGAAPARWALLDASLSMTAASRSGVSAWDAAQARASDLADEGWNVVSFGEALQALDLEVAERPAGTRTLLAPALERVAEAGGREVVVLSDLRFEDPVAVRSALDLLPLDVGFEAFGDELVNAGISAFEVSDAPRPEETVRAEIEVHGGIPGDSLSIGVMEEGRAVAALSVPAPSSGLRSRVTLELPNPATMGRVRYTARVTVAGDAFESDDAAPAYAVVGRQEGGLVLVSVAPDWEPRFLLPVLEDVTGLPAAGFLRAGADRFVQVGRAVSRGGPVDSASVRAAAMDAALLVVHGIGEELDPWARSLLGRTGRRVLFVRDAYGAAEVGVRSGSPRAGEWFASSDFPSSPVVGELSGLVLEGLPPLTNVLVPAEKDGLQTPFMIQFRGAGLREAPIYLDEREDGRVALILASGLWRWAARPDGADAYRRLWSGVAGWLLAEQSVAAAAPRPSRWVTPRGEAVTWIVPKGHGGSRLIVRAGDSLAVDLTLPEAAAASVGELAPGTYAYVTLATGGDTTAVGRFDVASATLEMSPAATEPEGPARASGLPGRSRPSGRPIRTSPWPYLLIITLLCAEWIGRRRSGLR